MEIPPLKTFIIYARADGHFKSALRRQMTPMEQMGLLDVWDDSHLLPGEEWEKSIEQKLDESDLVIMLVSEASLFSSFIQKKELKTTLERKQRGVTQFVPILVRDCLWDLLPDFSAVQMLPVDAARNILAVEAWLSHSSAWAAALRELHRLIPDIQKKVAAEKQARAEALAADEAAQQAQVALLQQQAAATKAEKQRHSRDEAAWKRILVEVETAATAEDKIEIYNTYLENQQNHTEEAEGAIHALEGELVVARQLAEKRAQAGERRRAEAVEKERQRKLEDTDHKAYAVAHTRADLEAYLKKYTLHAAEAQKRIAALQIEEEKEKAAKDLPEMILVKGGHFQMGDTFDEGLDREKPVHTVTVSDFYLGKYAVTFEEYDRFCDETKRERPGDQGWGRARRPVINVSWGDAQAYSQWLSEKTGLKFRLPTEAEWEYAARSPAVGTEVGERGKKIRFGNGKDVANPAEINFNGKKEHKKSYSTVGEYRAKTVPVGSLDSYNALGLHDMSGNIWEWCADWYGDYSASAQTNPTGPKDGPFRVFRGGSWSDYPQRCRVADRSFSAPGSRYSYLGAAQYAARFCPGA